MTLSLHAGCEEAELFHSSMYTAAPSAHSYYIAMLGGYKAAYSSAAAAAGRLPWASCVSLISFESPSQQNPKGHSQRWVVQDHVMACAGQERSSMSGSCSAYWGERAL